MTYRRVVLCCLAGLAFAASGAGQTPENLPGYFALEELGLFQDGNIEVDIDLKGSMAQVLAAATADEDPTFSAAMEKIQRIRVQVGTTADADRDRIRATVDGAVARLEQSGWYRMVAVRDDEEVVYLMALESAGVLQGLTVFVDDGDGELVLVNVAGEMSPEVIGSLVRNVDQLEGMKAELQGGLAGQ